MESQTFNAAAADNLGRFQQFMFFHVPQDNCPVKGMFVHPAQVAEVIKRHQEILRARLIIDQRDGVDVMTLSCEINNPEAAAEGINNLGGDISATIQAVCKLKGEVGFAEPGSLPNDGKVIDDIREYE